MANDIADDVKSIALKMNHLITQICSQLKTEKGYCSLTSLNRPLIRSTTNTSSQQLTLVVLNDHP